MMKYDDEILIYLAEKSIINFEQFKSECFLGTNPILIDKLLKNFFLYRNQWKINKKKFMILRIANIFIEKKYFKLCKDYFNLIKEKLQKTYVHICIDEFDNLLLSRTREKAEEFLDILQNQERFGLIAVSLGYFDTLMNCSGAATSSEISCNISSDICSPSSNLRRGIFKKLLFILKRF